MNTNKKREIQIKNRDRQECHDIHLLRLPLVVSGKTGNTILYSRRYRSILIKAMKSVGLLLPLGSSELDADAHLGIRVHWRSFADDSPSLIPKIK